jgi:alkyldihydroxyacetonephosphate synthase
MPDPHPSVRGDLLRSALERLLPGRVDTDPDRRREASIDRFKKYQAVHGVSSAPPPAAIVLPTSTAEVAAVLGFAEEHRVSVVPRTGGTSTEGGLETVLEDSLVLDGSAMDRILDIDETDLQVTAQCGVPLQVLEDAVRARGLTTGHSPQSMPVAQLGGLVATRSTGQLSTLYGGIEDLVVGLEAVFPGGRVARVKSVPRRAAGPDIRHVVIGSEGALCFITEVTLKLFRHYPGHRRHLGLLMDDFAAGVEGLRRVVTAGYRPSVARAYSPEDAAQHFPEAAASGQSVVVLVADGPEPLVEATLTGIEEAFSTLPHHSLDPGVVERWLSDLNWGPERIEAERASMRQHAHLGYTTEVSVDWSRVVPLYESVMTRIRATFPRAGDLTMLGAHSSHSYQTGTNLYFVYDYEIRCAPEEEIRAYHIPLNAIIVEEALRFEGSMVHHHGVGKYRTPWVREEHGSAYFLLEGLKRQLDPRGVMNPGTLYPIAEFTEPMP